LGPDHPETFGAAVNLGNSYTGLGRHADAVKLYEETLANMRIKIPDHPYTFNCMMGLAGGYANLGLDAKARSLGEETLKLTKAKFGERHPMTARMTWNMACLYAGMAARSTEPEKDKELAVDCLKQAIAAGFTNVEKIKKDTDLDPLRDRENFKKLIAELEAKKP
jgi:hypothetical protein